MRKKLKVKSSKWKAVRRAGVWRNQEVVKMGS